MAPIDLFSLQRPGRCLGLLLLAFALAPAAADFPAPSRALLPVGGEPANLLELISRPPLGLPGVPLPAGNPPTEASIALGRKMFFDRRLSFNGTLSCAMCHIPEQGFTQNELQLPVGIEGRFVKRNAPTLYNVAYRLALFHDGRESTLENQVWQPLLRDNEMANPSIGFVLDTLNSRFDRWFFGGDDSVMDAPARRGFELFRDVGCSSCHTLAQDYAHFSNDEFYDTGVGWARAMLADGKRDQAVRLAPGVMVVPEVSFASPESNDVGRYEATGDPDDRWHYRTPSLRNVALTAPYMHDGSFPTLASVLEYYNRGAQPHPGLDPRLRPLNLDAAQLKDLQRFLESLTGDNTELLRADGRTEGIGDSL
jgi:cytochrome c peroxidase